MVRRTKRRLGRRLLLAAFVLAAAVPAVAWWLGWLEIGPAETGWGIHLGSEQGEEPAASDAAADPFAQDQGQRLQRKALIDPIIFQAQHEPEPVAISEGGTADRPPAVEPGPGSPVGPVLPPASFGSADGASGTARRISSILPTAAETAAPGNSRPPGSASKIPSGDTRFVPSRETSSKTSDNGSSVRLADAHTAQPVSPPAVEAEASSSETPAAKPATAPIDLDAIDRLIQSGDDIAAHRELSRIYWQRPELRPLIRERLRATAERIFFSPLPHYMEPYVVQPGDQLRKIAKKYKVPWPYLARLNRVDPRRIRAGQKLKVIRGPFSAFIDLSDFELTVHLHGYYVKSYRVGIGQDGTTPTGTFTVLNKVVNPQYTDPEGRVIDADDPTNPLGERWIDLGDGYGIHGTIEPDSIGRAVSRGCIRMLNDDVAEVFDFLTEGSEVVIQP
ncbi:MAG TPA: LysM peptidoglycan-binding domain-containing protein [Planctomycetaceae bacterium]|nr:LysM peptidoglycan-binding domain-containing protein [Planctomycetaceae bacterium]